jgi:hypothetical protein
VNKPSSQPFTLTTSNPVDYDACARRAEESAVMLPPKEQLEILRRGTEEIIPSKSWGAS